MIVIINVVLCSYFESYIVCVNIWKSLATTLVVLTYTWITRIACTSVVICSRSTPHGIRLCNPWTGTTSCTNRHSMYQWYSLRFILISASKMIIRASSSIFELADRLLIHVMNRNSSTFRWFCRPGQPFHQQTSRDILDLVIADTGFSGCFRQSLTFLNSVEWEVPFISEKLRLRHLERFQTIIHNLHFSR